MRQQSLSIVLAVSVLCGCGSGADTERPTAAIAAPPFTLDTHIDIPLDFATASVDPLNADLQVNLEKMVSGALSSGFFIVYVGQSARTDEGYAQAQADALTKFAAIHRMAELYPARIEIAYRADDVARIAASGKLVAAIGVENGFTLGRNIEMLDRFHELGARYVGLVHDGDNDLARSARPRPELGDPADAGRDARGRATQARAGTPAVEQGREQLPGAVAESTAGVTALGAEAIARLNQLGIMVDVSHGSKQTALDAMRLSAAPVIASHSGIAGVNAHARNMDDETLLALKADGGVVQVVAYDAYLKHQPDEQTAALRELRERVGLTTGPPSALPPAQRTAYDDGMREIQARWPPASVADLVDHIDYAVELIGVDHVGLSSDFGGGGGVTGWNDATETRNVTAELQRRGYSDADIAKIWAGNLLRVWRAAEDTAAALAASSR